MNKKAASELKKMGITWRNFDDILTEQLKNNEFRKEFESERNRRRLAHQIYDLRTSKRLTQQVVARKAGMPQSVIARIESGERGISVDSLGRVARALGKEIQ